MMVEKIFFLNILWTSVILLCSNEFVTARDLGQLMLQVQCSGQCYQNFSKHHCEKLQNHIKQFEKSESCYEICQDLGDVCFSFCSCIKNFPKDTTSSRQNENWLPRLHCRSENSLVFKWSDTSRDQIKNAVLQLRDENDKSVYNMTSDEEIVSFEKLRSDQGYTLEVWRYDVGGWEQSKALTVKTLPESFVLHPIANISLEELILQPDKNYFTADIRWTPAEEMVCNYEAVWWMNDKYEQREINKPNELYQMQLEDLEFDQKYSLAITAIALNQNITESPKLIFNFLTPTCLETFKNLSVCAPPPPVGLEAKEIPAKLAPDGNTFLYNVTLEWTQPEFIPSYYNIKLINILSNITPIAKNVSGNFNFAEFFLVPLGNQYQISIRAVSDGGVSDEAEAYRVTVQRPITIIEETQFFNKNQLFIGISIIVPVLFVSCSLLFINKRLKNRAIKERSKYFKDHDKKFTKQNLTITRDITSSDEGDDYCVYEIARDRVVLDRVLGEGAFGIVRHGWILPDKREIAVKTLKEGAAADEVQQLKDEIKVMKTVGVHTHIVSMVGCCTEGKITDIMLLVEYCALGDLLGYLRRSWSALQQSCCSTPNTPLNNIHAEIFFANSLRIPNAKVNQMYEIEDQLHNSNDAILTSIDLLSFARQIAMGMEYLSSNRIVHRDLAARNILLTADRTLKIADFGLSRDIYAENIYRRKGNGKLPVKWMALEALSHQIYTTQSDVWSFGILLWEIVTLGGNPYPSTPTNRLLPLLKSGYRMECPANCRPEVYALMHSCWNYQPKDRPTFHQIRVTLEALLENSSQIQYLNLDELSQSEYTRDSIGNHYEGLINR